jgi:hypothetical protein
MSDKKSRVTATLVRGLAVGAPMYYTPGVGAWEGCADSIYTDPSENPGCCYCVSSGGLDWMWCKALDCDTCYGTSYCYYS